MTRRKRLLDRLRFDLTRAFRSKQIRVEEGPIPGSYKWVPVISQSYCTGCARCVEACDHGCLEMVWDFATLLRPDDCGSEGNCVDVCPEELIRMEWLPMDGDPNVGRWCQVAGPP